MKRYAMAVVCMAGVFSSCGGDKKSADTTPSPSNDNIAAPAEETGGAGSEASSATAETDGADVETAAPGDKPAKEASAAQEPSKPTATADKEQVKEASEARITDKNIVISGKVLFETGNAKLKTVSFPVLDEVVYALEKHPEIIMLQVVGHTDSDGDAKANKSLSKRRATSVMNYLIKKGIERDRLSAVGQGEDQPIASNDTEEGKDKNRRVEFVIVERAKVMATTFTAGTAAPGKVDSRKATDDETEDLIKKEGLDKKSW